MFVPKQSATIFVFDGASPATRVKPQQDAGLED